MTDADYADDITLLLNTHAQPKSLLHSLEQTAGSISLHINTKQSTCVLKQEGSISTLNGWPLKLVDMFTYLGSNISSTESDVNIHRVKAWSAINRLSIIWKSNLSNEIKRDFFQTEAAIILMCGYTTWMLTHKEKSTWELHKNATSYFEQILETTPHETTAV